MVHSVRYTCVLDTNVIYPLEIRDLLLWFAHFELFTPKWSETIFEEWVNVMKSKGISDKEIKKRVDNVDLAFPDAKVSDYKGLIASLNFFVYFLDFPFIIYVTIIS